MAVNDQLVTSRLDPAARVAKIKKALKRPDSEDARFERTQFLRKAEVWLGDYRSGVRDTPPLALLHVRVMRALRDWERVVSVVRATDWRKDATRARALLEAAEAHMDLQEFPSANGCLEEAVRLAPELEERVAQVRKRLEAQLGSHLYGTLSALAYGAARSHEAEALEHFYRSAASVRGMPKVAAEEAVSVLRTLAGKPADGAVVEERADVQDGCRIIMTCGSGYSGTGAVTAYLRDLEGLPMPFGLRELGMLKKNYGLSRLIAKWEGWSAEERDEGVRQMVLQAIVGVPCFDAPSKVDRLHTRSVTVNSLFAGERLGDADARSLGSLARAFVASARSDVSLEALKAASTKFVNGVLRLRGGDVALFNNCIHQTQMFMCELLENARVIVIARDPRDQYVAHQTETQGKGITVEAFIRKRKRADVAVARYLASGRSNVRRFGFEAFVADADVREEVKSWAGVAHLCQVSPPQHFFPEKSQRNVGIHVKWKKQSEIRLIERELPDQLVDA